MKLIHCADLHLDSKMESNLTKEQAKERKAEILLTYCQMVDYAKKNDVNVIMIAGDMFDTKKVTKRTRNVVLDSIVSNPEIDFLYLSGNHDNSSFLTELQADSADGQLPKNLKLFHENWTYYTYDGVVISGVELTEQNTEAIYDALILEPDQFNIVMPHGQEAKYKGKDKTEIINLTALKNRNIDYLALGHIHAYKEGKLDRRGTYCYSGCLEGRGFDECGQKGFVLLDIKDGNLSKTFIPMGKRFLHEVRLDVNNFKTSSEVVKAMEDAVMNIPREDLVKVMLTGAVDLDVEFDLSYFNKVLKEDFYFGKVTDETTLSVHLEELAYDVSLKGEFLRMVLADKKLSEKDKEQISLLGVKALAGEELGL